MGVWFLAEMAFSARSTAESDVYSYGVVLLEPITRKMAVDPFLPDNMEIFSWVSSTLNGSNQIEVISDPALMHEVYGTVEMKEVRKGAVVSSSMHSEGGESKAFHDQCCERADRWKACRWLIFEAGETRFQQFLMAGRKEMFKPLTSILVATGFSCLVLEPSCPSTVVLT